MTFRDEILKLAEEEGRLDDFVLTRADFDDYIELLGSGIDPPYIDSSLSFELRLVELRLRRAWLWYGFGFGLDQIAAEVFEIARFVLDSDVEHLQDPSRGGLAYLLRLVGGRDEGFELASRWQPKPEDHPEFVDAILGFDRPDLYPRAAFGDSATQERTERQYELLDLSLIHI